MDLLQAAKDKKLDLSGRFTRMKTDVVTHYFLSDYTFVDSGDKKYPKADSITSNKPRTFADKVIAYLSSATRHYTITKQDGKTNDSCSKAERYLDYELKRAIDINLIDGVYPFVDAVNSYACLEGTAVLVCILYRSGDSYYPYIRALDPYGFVWENGKNGFRAINVTM